MGKEGELKMFFRVFTREDGEAIVYMIETISNGLRKERATRENRINILKGVLLACPAVLFYIAATILFTYFMVKDWKYDLTSTDLRELLPYLLTTCALTSFAVFFVLIIFISDFIITKFESYHLGCTFFIVSMIVAIMFIVICWIAPFDFNNFFYTNFNNFFF